MYIFFLMINNSFKSKVLLFFMSLKSVCFLFFFFLRFIPRAAVMHSIFLLVLIAFALLRKYRVCWTSYYCCKSEIIMQVEGMRKALLNNQERRGGRGGKIKFPSASWYFFIILFYFADEAEFLLLSFFFSVQFSIVFGFRDFVLKLCEHFESDLINW